VKALKVTALGMLLALALPAGAGERWTNLFNGKDLSGWVNQGGNWRVITLDGVPTLECFRGGGSLTYHKPFGDMVLDLEFRLPPGQNSGIFFRGSRIVPGGYPPPASSYEVQLYDHKEMWGHRTGDLLYAHRARRWASQPDEWNHCVIISVGRRHKCYLNGQCVFDVIDIGRTPERGYIALQAHGGRVLYRRVRVREITDGKWPEETGKIKALLFVGESRGIGRRVDIHGALIEKCLDDTGRFEITWSPEELALTPRYLDYYDLVILYDNRPDLSPAARKRLEEFVAAGRGLVVLNRSVTGTFANWAEFARMTGCSQKASWGGSREFEVKVADSHHPVALGLRPFKIRDTLPEGVSLGQGVEPFLVAGDRPVAWANRFGKGKVVCIVLGEEQTSLTNPGFGRLLINAATWVALPKPPPRVADLVKAGDAKALAAMLHQPPVKDDLPLLDALGRVGNAAAADALAAVAAGNGSLVARLYAIEWLGRLGARGSTLTKLLAKDPRWLVRAAAAGALGSPRFEASVPSLAGALNDEADPVREKAVEALGSIASPEAKKVLLAKLEGPDKSLHEGILRALADAGDPEVRAALVRLATKRAADYAHVLPTIARMLARQVEAPGVFKAMVALLDSGVGEARVAAADALAASGDPRVHDILLPRVFGTDPKVARVAQNYVRKVGKVDLTKFIGPFIRRWLVIGPFPNDRGKGFDMVFPPEKKIEPGAEYEAVGGLARWRAVETKGDAVSLTQVFPKHNQNVVAYACVVVESPVACQVQLWTGSDDGIAAWLNGKKVLGVNRPRGLLPDEDRTPVELRRGANVLLLKIVQGGGDWAFCARFADPKGRLPRLAFRLPEK